MRTEEINEIIRTNSTLSDEELSQKCGVSTQAVRNRRTRLAKQLSTTDQIKRDRKISTLAEDKRATDKKYKRALEEIDRLEDELGAVSQLMTTPQTFTIVPATHKESEATAFMVASDWHFEEKVDPDVVSNLNEFNPTIARQRAVNFFQNGLRLLDIFNDHSNISTLVLALLGDFINNDIHEELAESNYLSPIDSALEVQNILISGIQAILDQTDVNLVVPCNSGNHARTTKERRISTEAGHSLEYYIYNNLALFFKNNPRVQFVIAKGYFVHLELYGHTIRLHHGHDLRYNGGVGGIYIPVNKAIAQWNKARPVTLDVFGHWHQQRDGGNFICNGSLIGYNAYGQSIKADYEEPKQTFFLFDERRKKSVVAPIDL